MRGDLVEDAAVGARLGRALASDPLRLFHEGLQAPEGLGRLAHPLVGELERVAIVRAEKVETERFRLVPLDHVLDPERVAQRLGHLLRREIHEAVVGPAAHEGLPRGAFGLGDLVLVVRKDQVLAPAVEVKGLAQVLHSHDGALDVPARPAGAPRGWPRGLAGLGRLPQREVERVALALVDIHPRSRLELVEILARELSIRREAAHLEVHVAFQHVG